MGTHSTLSASGAHRWLACPGSVALCEGLPRVPNAYAELGTAAHKLGEWALRQGKNALDYLGKTVHKSEVDGQFIPVDQEMAEAVQVYLDGIRQQMKDLPGATLLIEQKFNLDWLFPEMFGTNDSCVFQAFGTMHVNDYKHGQGVKVGAKENPQLMYYGLGALGEKNNSCVEKVVISIFQPRGGGEPVKVWETTPEALYQWGQDVLLPAAKRTQEPDAPLAAGDHCKFCPASAHCPAKREVALKAAQVAFGKDILPIGGKASVNLTPPKLLSTEQLEIVHEVGDIITDWAKEVEAELKSRLERGADSSRYKLVQGRKTRDWADETVTLDALKPMIDPWESKIVSPAQAEKKLKAAGYDPAEVLPQLVVEKHGTAMVPKSDKRPALPATAFTALSTTNEKE